MRAWLRSAVVALGLTLAACATRQIPPPPAQPPQPVQPTPPPPANALQAGVSLSGSAILNESDAEQALGAFRASCRSVTKRTDKSGLTNPADWVGVCAQANLVPAGGASGFFQSAFDWVRVGDGKAFATGYYEPEIAASPLQAPGYTVPIYVVPPDLTR